MRNFSLRNYFKEKIQYRSFFAYFLFKESRLVTVAVRCAATGAATGTTAVVTAAETAVRAEEQKREDYDPEALIVLK